jgi:FkbM family methyltransferase
MMTNGLRSAIATRVREWETVDELALAHDFFKGGRDGRLLIDVGAHHGESFQNFAEDGWNVHAFEPDPRNCAQIRAQWGASENVVIDRRVVADADDARVSFLMSNNTYISSKSAFDASHVESVTVEQVALSSYCSEKKITHVDLLKVDAEGFDYTVLKGFPWSAIKPRLVICEFEDRKSQSRGYGFREMADLLLSHGYHIMVSEWHPIVSYSGPFSWNRFYLYTGQPPCENGNGNLMAVIGRPDLRRLQGLCRTKAIYHFWASTFRAAYARLHKPEQVEAQR